MKHSDVGKMALVIVVLSALTGCSTNGHRTDSYNSRAEGYESRTAGGTNGSGVVEVVEDVADVVGTIVSIAGLFWGMEQYEKMNDWGMVQYEAMNDRFNKVYTGNIDSYGRGF